LLIGVDNEGRVVGYEPPGRADLQDHMRQLLRAQVDPVPPFATAMVPLDGHRVGVVRVGESSDTPHITNEGVIYVRNDGGKQRVVDHRDIVALARRGDLAQTRADDRLYELPLVHDAMRTPERIFGDNPTSGVEPWPLQEVIVRASPYTIGGSFADRALSKQLADQVQNVVTSLLPRPPRDSRQRVAVRARGVYSVAIGQEQGPLGGIVQADAVVDAGGVVALRLVVRCDPHVTELVRVGWFPALVEGAAALLGALDAYGRAAIGIEIRGATGLYMALSPQAFGEIKPDDLFGGNALRAGGDIALPADEADVQEVVDRWTRELGRAAGLPAWEPWPEPSSHEAGDDEPG
jgi:hypothetical protein